MRWTSPGTRRLQPVLAASRHTLATHTVLAAFTAHRTDVLEGSKTFPVTCRPSMSDRNMPFSPIILLSVIWKIITETGAGCWIADGETGS